MKKFLLSAAFAAVMMSASAESKVYFFSDQSGEFDQMGQVYCISPNGEYAVIYDEEMEHSFLWRRSDPEKLEFLNFERNGYTLATQVRAVTDNGTIVGSSRERGSNQWLPFVMKADGEIIPLPISEWALNLNFPCGISDNEAVIGGYLGGSCKMSDGSSFGQSRPAMWVKGTDGEYELIAPSNDELTLPEHCGTQVSGMYSDGTYENSYLYGACGCGVGSYIPFLYNQEKLQLWNKVELVKCPWYYQGQLKGYEIVETIDGKRDYLTTDDYLDASFSGSDAWGNIYGSRVEIVDLQSTDPEDVDAFGKASQVYYRGWYNVFTKEWTEKKEGPRVITGLDGDVLFTAGNSVYTGGLDGTENSVSSFVGNDFGGKDVLGVERTSADGKVLGACYMAYDATQKAHAYPLIIELDKELVGVDSVTADFESRQVVLTYGGTIEVVGAEQVAVYDLNGVNVANGNACNVGSGTYVVVADGVSHKVLVK